MQFQESRYKMAIDIILICYCNLPEEAMPCILHYRVVNTYISHTKKKKNATSFCRQTSNWHYARAFITATKLVQCFRHQVPAHTLPAL